MIFVMMDIMTMMIIMSINQNAIIVMEQANVHYQIAVVVGNGKIE